VHDLLVRAALKGDHLALVVEAEVEVERHLDPAPARVQDTRDYRRRVERRRLAVMGASCVRQISARALFPAKEKEKKGNERRT
jgi:hypothetical protein